MDRVLRAWVSSSEQVNSVVVLKIRPWQGDGLSFISQGGAGTKNVKFNSKDYANVGAVVDGFTASARPRDERFVEITDKVNGKVRDTQDISVSADGKTLTITLHILGRSDPDVQVFENLPWSAPGYGCGGGRLDASRHLGIQEVEE
jgi:hypothetical protein